MPGDPVEDLARIIAYVWHLGDLMRIRPLWELRVKIEEDPGGDEGADAHVDPTSGRYHAAISISEDAVKEGGDRLRYVAVHELVHLYHQESSDVIRKGLVPALSSQTYEVIWEMFSHQTELMVDRLATLIAPFMPTFEEFTATVS